MADSVVEQYYSVACRVAGVLATRTTRLYGLPADARRDLEQDVLLELWQKRAAFDPRRGCWQTFSEAVAVNKMTSLVRRMCSQHSAWLKEQPIARALSVEAPNRHNQLRDDVGRVLARVSPSDRRIARSLMYYSVAETSRSMGVSRPKVYRAISRLRLVFTVAGFANRGRKEVLK
ncbi:MAG: sigma-70 family RNA polymerase sigma factor [Acidobacteria bacterium]|nr:sigma-70 family RNA polymerase sigma factor [Acidobacteriota bacterium]